MPITIDLDRQQFDEGIQLLKQPVLPLVSMVQFLFLTGSFSRVEEVIDQMPVPIETGYALYDDPQGLLRRHLGSLRMLEQLNKDSGDTVNVLSVDDEPLDTMTACTALMQQKILTAELEEINSLLCAPCGCTLCCTGPEKDMQQDFFEIPLRDSEIELFPVERIDTPESRAARSMDEPPLVTPEDTPFYHRGQTGLFHWQNGWSLILPTGSTCPNLDLADGRCGVYTDRPEVCRRPQIFAYVVEPISEGQSSGWRLRNSLLAVVDCPYVTLLKDEIAAFSAACELDIIFKQNKG